MSLEEILEDLIVRFPKCKIEFYESMIWLQYRNDDDVINFEIYDNTTIDASSEKTGIQYKKDLVEIIKTVSEHILPNQIPSYVIETFISNLYDSAGFYEDDDERKEELPTSKMDAFWTEIKKEIKDHNREILFVSFGEKFKKPSSMEQNKISLDLPFRCDKTFDARHINSSKPKGGGLHNLRGTDEIVQRCVESGSGFEFVLSCIVKSIETNNYNVVGIYCTAGHHRSVALVELLHKYLYSNAKIKHLHINR
jgi:hypothetical protein